MDELPPPQLPQKLPKGWLRSNYCTATYVLSVSIGTTYTSRLSLRTRFIEERVYLDGYLLAVVKHSHTDVPRACAAAAQGLRVRAAQTLLARLGNRDKPLPF